MEYSLTVLAVVPLAIGQAKQPLLKDRVLAVPQGQREAKKLAIVGNPAQTVFTHRYARERAWSWVKQFHASPDWL